MNQIRDVLEAKLSNNDVIDSVQSVTQEINNITGSNHPTSIVRHVMKYGLGMSFSKVKEISTNENSIRSLILRQQFAIKYLENAQRRQRIINVD